MGQPELTIESGSDEDLLLLPTPSKSASKARGKKRKTPARTAAVPRSSAPKPSPKPFDAAAFHALAFEAPLSREELAVSKRSAEEVREWLGRRSSGLLVLAGPTGVGKTATLRAVAAELRLPLLEWTAPSGGHLDGGADGDLAALEDFLQAVDLGRDTPLVLLEDLPEAAFRQPHDFRRLIAEAQERLRLVVLVSDSRTSSCLNGRRLLPPAFLAQLGAASLQFKACPPSFVVRALRRVLGLVGAALPKERLAELAEASEGDVRAALQSMELSLRGESATGAKDSTLLLFRLIGKFLYSKREEGVSAQLPPLAFCPEEVVERCGIESESFCLLLHHNFPAFLKEPGDLRGLSRTLGDFALVDALRLSDVSERAKRERYAGSLVGRSVALHNFSATGRKPRFQPIYKARWWELKERQESLHRRVEASGDPGDRSFFLDTAPLLGPLSTRLEPSLRGVVRDLASFPRHALPGLTEQLSESLEFLNATSISPQPFAEADEQTENPEFIPHAELSIDEDD